jgi:hypothetical protein
MLSQQQTIFAKNVAQLILFIEDSGKHCTFGEAYRSPEQAAIYAKEGKGIKNSLHCLRLAVDLNLFDSNFTYRIDAEFYMPVADYWKKLHVQNRAGIDFHKVDSNHFEMRLI